jgi:polysaccharide biosynthesis transport protein
MKSKKIKKIAFALAVLIAVPVGANVLGLFMPKRYSAEMRVLIDETPATMPLEMSQFQNISDLENQGRPRSPQTQLDIITGSDVLLAAINIAHDKMPDKVKIDDEHLGDIYQSLVKRLGVDNEMNSDILTLKVTQSDPDVAAEIANDIGLAYQQYLKKLSAQVGEQEEQLLTTTIDQAKTQLKTVDKQIDDVKTQAHIADLQSAEQAAEANRETAEQKLADISGQYNGAVSSLHTAEEQLQSIPRTISTGSSTQANPVLLSVEQTLAAERVSLVDLQSKYDDSFPDVKHERLRVASLEKQIKGMKQSIDSTASLGPNPVYQQQLTNVVGLRGQVQSLAMQYSSAQAEYQKASAQAAGIPAAEQKLQALTRDRTVAEQNYEALDQKLSAIRAGGVAREPQVTIVSPAYPPTTPSFPDPRFLTIAGLAIGGFLAILILMPRPESPYNTDRTVVETAAAPAVSEGDQPEPLAAPRRGRPVKQYEA